MCDNGQATSQRSYTACSMPDGNDRADADPKVWLNDFLQCAIRESKTEYVLPVEVFYMFVLNKSELQWKAFVILQMIVGTSAFGLVLDTRYAYGPGPISLRVDQAQKVWFL